MIVVIDTETTHYKPDLAHVIEIGAIVDHPKIGELTFESLCNPGIDLDLAEEALRINGISKEEVLGAPPIKEVANEFRQWLKGVAGWNLGHIHYAGFNSKNYDALILAKPPWNLNLANWKYDVMEMAIGPMGRAGVLPKHSYYGSYKWPKLSEAERFYGIIRDGKAHRALSDARATKDILRMIMMGGSDGQ